MADKLTIEEVEALCQKPATPLFCVIRENGENISGGWPILTRQLANTMRENERLRAAIGEMISLCELPKHDAVPQIHRLGYAILEGQQHKQSEMTPFEKNRLNEYNAQTEAAKASKTSAHQWDTSIRGDYRCCRCGMRAQDGKTDLPCNPY